MKTMLDLPDALVDEVKLRALHEGRKLQDKVADLLRAGLEATRHPGAGPSELASPRVGTDPQTGLPVILCHPDAPATRMTAEELIASEQATQTEEDLERLGLSG